MSKKKIPGLKLTPAYSNFSKEKTFTVLEKGILEIFSSSSNNKISFEELYRSCYLLVLNKHGSFLYSQIESIINQELLNKQISTCLEILQIFTDFSLKLSLIRDVLMYLDRSFIPTHSLKSINDLGMSRFKEIILLENTQLITKYFLVKVEQERLQNYNQDFDDLKKITEMYYSFNVYFTILEKEFLQDSRDFYKRQVDSVCLLGVSKYLAGVEKRIGEEKGRMEKYMRGETTGKIIELILEEMVRKQRDWILNADSGFTKMIRDDMASLGLLYDLVSKVEEGVESISRKFCDNLVENVEQVHKCVSGQKSSSSFTTWIDGLLEIKAKTENILKGPFKKDKVIIGQAMNTLKVMINQNLKACEFTSLYIDLLLKKGLKGRTDEEVEDALEKIMGIFRFLDEKDVFDRYYKQHLARRLLSGKSIGEEIETSMISKFKLECGYQFTTKLEGMFNDIRLSAELVRKFNNKFGKENIGHLPALNIYVLTSTFWPLTVSKEFSEVVFPSEVQGLMDRFEKFYHSQHSGRILSWLYNMGSVDLKIQFLTCKKEINMPVLSMLILLTCFKESNSGSVTFQKVLELTSIPSADLIRNLQTLSLGKYRILIKSTPSKDISSSDTFTFNADFKSSLTKIKIMGIGNSGNVVEDDNERSKTMEKVEEARKHQIEAAIVRIMKARQTMEHSNLVAEVISQLSSHFSPSPIMVKKRIEGLIEREYMDRDKGDIRKYIYMA